MELPKMTRLEKLLFERQLGHCPVCDMVPATHLVRMIEDTPENVRRYGRGVIDNPDNCRLVCLKASCAKQFCLAEKPWTRALLARSLGAEEAE